MQRAQTNTQEYAFQFGVDVPSGSGPFTARTRIVGPFAGLTPQAGQSMGLFIGTGDQDNYFKLIVSGASGGGVQWVKEVGGVVTTGTFNAIALPGPSAIDLYLTVDPTDATVQGELHRDQRRSHWPSHQPRHTHCHPIELVDRQHGISGRHHFLLGRSGSNLPCHVGLPPGHTRDHRARRP